MKTHTGASNVAVTVISVAVLIVVLLFFWQVFAYYRMIRSGGTPDLPQFSAQLSAFAQAPEGNAPGRVERPAVETADDPFLGAEDAELVIVEFIDYECPFCKDVSGTVRRVASRYGDRVKVITRDFPVLELHPNAMTAAEAVGCAEAQGAYWQMHDRVFAENGTLNRETLDRLAFQSGVERGSYLTCMEDHARLDEIEADLAAGKAAGVRGTPTFFFNGQRVEGAIPDTMFEELIKGFLGET